MLITNSYAVVTDPSGRHHTAPQPPESPCHPAACANHVLPAVLQEACRDRITVEAATSPSRIAEPEAHHPTASGGKAGKVTPQTSSR